MSAYADVVDCLETLSDRVGTFRRCARMTIAKCAALSASACVVRNTSQPRAFRRAPLRKCEAKIHIRETQTGSCYSFRLQERPVAYADLREFVKRLEKEGLLRLEYGGVTIVDIERLRHYGE